jgi:NAD(P)-dependent dehydrogenase (short-subunit alcohol dehydrogenase family)
MMDIDLKGKVAIVTGAGRGIGRAMAIALAKAGAKVTITAAREKNELNAVIDEISRLTGRDTVHAVIADVTDERACRKIRDATLERLGGLHVLVNNAARGHKYIHDANPGAPMDFWNANGPFLMAKAVTPHLLAQKWGRIVNIGVTPSSMQKKRNSPYGVSKAALESETLIWAQELAGTGVTCNSLSPGGATLTGMVYGKDRERAGLADPEIMGIPIVWLASEQSSWCNGQRLIAKDWNAALDPDEAARQSIAAPALTPPSTDAPATMR